MKENSTLTKPLDLSVLIPITERVDDIEQIFTVHRDFLENKNFSYEFIFVLDGSFSEAEKKLDVISAANSSLVKVIKFNRYFGEAKALSAAFNESKGERILTLASYFQVVPTEIQKLFDNFNDDVDVVFGARYPRKDNFLNRIQAKVFHGIINYLVNESFQDISCSVRLMRRSVMEKIAVYGDLHRFIPLLAIHKGFKVKEIALRQADQDTSLRIYQPGVYVRRLLDILSLFFLIKFTQKPLRFFGLWGVGLGFIGSVITGITVVQRLFLDMGLSERPLFLVGVLLIVLGIQTFFIGLVAEIILFMHKPSEPQYHVEKYIE